MTTENETYDPDTTNEYKGHFIKIQYDDMAFNPRKEYDNAAVMACNHSRYNLGDERGFSKLYEALREHPNWDNEKNDYYTLATEGTFIARDNFQQLVEVAQSWGFEILPLYDHSGITMRTRAFSCPWDSGGVGVIFMSPAMIRETYIRKRVTKGLRKRAQALMVAEVEEYDLYLTGQVYWWGVYEEEDCDDILESCGGYIGDLGYVSLEARSSIDSLLAGQIHEQPALSLGAN